jgi:hypothetical protein
VQGIRRPKRARVYLLIASPAFAKHNLEIVLREMVVVRDWRRVMAKVTAIQVDPDAVTFADTFEAICDTLGGWYLLIEMTEDVRGGLPESHWSFLSGKPTKTSKKSQPTPA